MADKTEKAKAEPAQRPGFDDRGKAYKGVDPETGERRTVVLSELKREFGPKRGEEMYYAIGEATGAVPRSAGVNYTPDIALDGADEDVRAKVSQILTVKEA